MKIVDAPFSLENDGQLWVYFLGCGSAFSKIHYQTNLLIVKGADHLLVDCGTSCSRSLRQAGLSLLDIRNVVITHSHADHIGGLEEFILTHRYVAHTRPRVFIPRHYQQILWSQSLRGGAEHNERHNGRGLRFEDYLEVERPRRISRTDRDMHRFSVGDISIRTFRTRHYPEQAESWADAMYSIGLVIDERVVVSGDTQFDADLLPTVEPAGGAEAIFHDTQFFPGGIHASLAEIAELPEPTRSRMWLIHYGDNFADKRDEVRNLAFAGFAEEHRIYEFT
ncbi:MAG: MBL fold metallo-hydrolase [Alkalispirochaeta sp.]